MSDTAGKERRKTSNRALDIFVVLFCLSGATASLYYFYLDIYATFRSYSVVPAGTVTVKYNTVQRRLADRAVWDRLFEQSAVYSGDLVRIARLSGATLNIDENSIELGENTLIRIQKDEGPLQIEFSYGNISVVSGKDTGAILLSIGDQVVQVQPGAEINALSGDNGLVLRVTEGAAQVIKSGQVTNVPAGGIVVRDTEGNEVRQPMAAVIHPKPNAVLLKTEAGPLNVEFKWARMNMQPQELLRLEIAEDKNFKKIIQTVGNLDSNATASLNVGLWHWRLLHENNTLSSGRMSIVEAAAPTLLAPMVGGSAQVPVRYAGQEVQFRWAEVPDASYYLLNVSRTPEFIAPEINLQVQTTSYVNSDIDAGTWYWRVQPVFSTAYEGEARFSQVSSFQVQSASVASAPTPAPVTNDNYTVNTPSEAEQAQAAAEEEKKFEEVFMALREETRQIQEQQPQREQQEQLAQLTQQAQLEQREQLQQTTQIPAASQPKQESQPQKQPPQQPLRLRLVSPENNVVISGLSALRQPTVFRWATDEDVEFSRFVLSRRSNPLSGRPEIDIQNPGRAVSIPNLAEGVWYWTVEARSKDGFPITAASPRQIRVQPIPLLPTPGNRLPASGFVLGPEELRQREVIVFSWSRVEGANAYIVSIMKDGFPRKQQILQTDPISELTYTFDNYSVFDDTGTFYWQVEAVSYRDGIMEQHGTPGENKFMIDVPRPGRVKTKKTGVMYGQ
jgi:hypothetical protein